LRALDKIYIHCSAGPRGDLDYIRRLHTDPKPKGNGWSHIGYHFVIGNGFPTYESWRTQNYQKSSDGKLWIGLPLGTEGIQVRWDNRTSIGICLIGNQRFTLRQFQTLAKLCRDLVHGQGINPQMILGHREYWILKGKPTKKTCPNFDMDWFRGYVKQILWEGR
jgi:hypothetical protein